MADEAGVWVYKRMFLGLFLQLMNKALQCGEIKVYYPDRYRFVLYLETETCLVNIAHHGNPYFSEGFFIIITMVANSTLPL